ncbi:HAD-IIA family hydrolase [Mycolicibacter heraklionensis]|uniref:HAD-IIA family hydrolase n=1 Tax=Mycolicibacter heraklionensis TaxID=512402 RepID=UPI001F285F70|nr:HAD-IIA family hydrolase [Mycolicibacter heraklionensis]
MAEHGNGGDGPRGGRGSGDAGRRGRPGQSGSRPGQSGGGSFRGAGDQRRTPRGAGPDRDRRSQPPRDRDGSPRPPRDRDGVSRPARERDGAARPPRDYDRSARPRRDQDSTPRPPRAAGEETTPRYDDPPLPEGIEPKQLAPEVRRELSTLNRVTADAVACHLVAAGMLLDDDPEAALRHAKAARSRSTRITAVREAVGIAAYQCGDWSQALGELRAARRMGSKSALLPLIADCERGLGRPQRAIELATGPDAEQLEGDEADEMRIVAAGARADLGQLEQALTVLSSAPADPDRTGSTVARLHYAHAETLVALGRQGEALEWFLRAAAADTEGITDVEDRIAELGGGATLAEEYDCLLLDLDGTVFRGGEPTDGAVETLAELQSRALFITNNSSRGADEVAAHLNQLGFTATAEDVVTSGQIAAGLLAAQLPAGARVLVLGTDSLAAEIGAVGLEAVRLASDEPAAVIQGLSTELGWADLAEAALAIRAGALWMTTNVDNTLPSERGLLPGNGSMVAALRAATDAEPQVAGKPGPALLTAALARGEFYAPLVVGDRLDTDIAAANAAGLPSLMVLTGVSSARDAVGAAAERRPTYLGHDLRALNVDAGRLAIGPQPYWDLQVDGTTVTVAAAQPEEDDGDGLSVVRALASAVADAELAGRPFTVAAADGTADAALQQWSLLGTWP